MQFRHLYTVDILIYRSSATHCHMFALRKKQCNQPKWWDDECQQNIDHENLLLGQFRLTNNVRGYELYKIV
jgi:hypothetical protein